MPLAYKNLRISTRVRKGVLYGKIEGVFAIQCATFDGVRQFTVPYRTLDYSCVRRKWTFNLGWKSMSMQVFPRTASRLDQK
jgi:hypothetical protein